MTINKLFDLFIFILTIITGVIAIRNPMTIAKAIVWWAKLVSRRSISDPKARDAVELMENNASEYARKFDHQLMVIQRTGFVALLISFIGLCGLIFGK